MSTELTEFDLKSELWREYEMNDGFGGRTTYRIEEPVKLVVRTGGHTQRIIDKNGIVHLVPGPGYRGAVIRWKSKNPLNPVAF